MAWNGTSTRNGHNVRAPLLVDDSGSHDEKTPNGSSDDILDQENQRLTENLAGKVSRLKNLAFDMEGDAKDSNHYLSGMQEDFDGSTGLLSGTMNRVNHMIGNGKNNRRLMCYLVLGLVLVFVVSYYIISRFTSG